MTTSPNSPRDTLLHEYVLLQTVLLDGARNSCSVCAVVTASLCVLLLLGLPFLTSNKLVIDYDLHSCYNKKNNYDLLQPTPSITRKHTMLDQQAATKPKLLHLLPPSVPVALPLKIDITDDHVAAA